MTSFAARGRRHCGSLLSALALAGLVLLVWRLSDVLLLGFGGVLVAVLLRHLATALARVARLPAGVALLAVVLAIAGLAAAFLLSVGPQVAAQFEELWRTLPTALAAFRDVIGRYDWGRDLLEAGGTPRPGTLLNLATGLAGTVFNALSDLLLVLVVALFLAADPEPYRRGLLRLVPLSRRPRAGEVMDALGVGLWNWILGQSVAMLVVGLITAGGLMLIGIPLAVALASSRGCSTSSPISGPSSPAHRPCSWPSPRGRTRRCTRSGCSSCCRASRATC